MKGDTIHGTWDVNIKRGLIICNPSVCGIQYISELLAIAIWMLNTAVYFWYVAMIFEEADDCTSSELDVWDPPNPTTF